MLQESHQQISDMETQLQMESEKVYTLLSK